MHKLLKTFFIVTSVFINLNANALELGELNPNFVSYVKKIEKLLEKNRKCYLASIEISSFYKGEISSSNFPKGVDCIGDVKIGQGTINEKSGCALTFYNPNNDSFSNPKVMTEKPCDSGGFKTLMPMKAYLGMHGLSSVEAAILEPLSAPLKEPKIHPLFFADSEVKKWFVENSAKYSKILSDADKGKAIQECVKRECGGLGSETQNCIKFCKTGSSR